MASQGADDHFSLLNLIDRPVPFRDFSPFSSLSLPRLHDRAYQEKFQPRDDWWTDGRQSRVLTFSNPVLNLASRCLRRFLEEHSNYFHPRYRAFEWFYVAIPEGVYFDKFYELMKMEEEAKRDDPQRRAVLLPFWRWRGNFEKKDAPSGFRMDGIVVDVAGHFKQKIWNTIFLHGDPYGRNVACCLIENARQLADIILSLGRPVSDSRLYGSYGCTGQPFFVNVPIDSPLAFRWILACLYRDGVHDLAKKACSAFSAYDVAFAAKRRKNSGKWTLPTETVSPFPKNLVLPVGKDFGPAKKGRTTPFFLWTANDERLYFEKDQDLLRLDEDDWGRHQAVLGNTFGRIMGGPEGWVLPEKLQSTLDVSSRFLKDISALQKKSDALQEKYDRLKREIEEIKGTTTPREKRERQSFGSEKPSGSVTATDIVAADGVATDAAISSTPPVERKCTKRNGLIFSKTEEGDKTFVNMKSLSLKIANKAVQTKGEYEISICVICLYRRRNVTFLYCGHVVSCRVCADKFDECPVCRARIFGTVPFYLS